MNCSNKVVLGLGSNRCFCDKSPLELLEDACNKLSSFVLDLKFSSVYRTKPMYVENQEDFYNMVVSGNCFLSPDELLIKIHEIESFLGRNRNLEIRNGPRSIDIDIELFGDKIIKTAELIIPHPRITERAFVLVPLLEILPESADVITGKSYASFLAALPTDEIQEVHNGRTNISSKKCN